MSKTSSSTSAAARAFLTELVDYAGLFPPAQLPLGPAISNYAAYRRRLDAWLLGRFIVPAGQLPALGEFAYLFDPEFPFHFAVLGSGGADAGAWLANHLADQVAVARFLQRHAPAVTVQVFETKLPPALFDTPDAAAITALLTKAAEDVPAGQQPFYELPLPPRAAGWEEGTRALIAAIAAFNAAEPRQPAGFKLRCGGVSDDLYPAPAQVALAIHAAAAAGLTFKATAGLHHPLRHFNEEAGATMHGFLNVFGAALLARHANLDAEILTEMIGDEAADHFRFDDDGFHWGEHSVPLAAIESGRGLALSFGSCSFDEPREDLRELEII